MMKEWQQQIKRILTEFQEQAGLGKKDVFVIGCSTSEVGGGKIGTSGTFEAAEMIFNELEKFRQ